MPKVCPAYPYADNGLDATQLADSGIEARWIQLHSLVY